ncbi:MAG: RlmE family RNA methyltransferase [Candidatus Thermoplasmatota archaeon]|nr:RlmE family RNA methyltransferase [Candidatus Thermoplasmatota archaeon]
MTERWQREKKKEHYYRQAKKEGYRSRAAYKLKQINKKYNVIRKGDAVIDLGAAPGGWSQIAKEAVGNGFVFGIDLEAIEPIEGVELLRGDLTKKEVVEHITSIIRKADVVISDMSANISGAYNVDHARSVYLCEHALSFAEKILKRGGNFVVKIFEGDMFKDYFEKVKNSFDYVKVCRPGATRKSSSEVYIIGKGFKGL